MKRNILIRFWVVIGILALAGSASGANSVDDQVKSLAQQYKRVEDQLSRSVHYVGKTESDGVTTIEQAWFNGADDLIKAAVERTDSSGRELTEYFALDFDNDYDGMFMLTRKEKPAPDGGVQVEESRKYFGEAKNGGNGVLIRELRKSAHFKLGEPTDTVRAPNVVVDLSEKKNQLTEDELRELLNAPTKMADELREGVPEFEPFANIKGDGDKYRIIHGSASPNGRFAIALGFARESIDWNALIDHDFSPTTYRSESEEDVRNYVVDLAQKKILGETSAAWSGTRRRYNHPECVVTWSPDSSFFVQLLANKWSSDDCVAGKIVSGPKFVGAVNLLKPLSPKIYAFVKKRFDREEGGSLSFSTEKVANGGTVEMKAYQYIASGDRKGDADFGVSVRLGLRETPKGLSIEGANMRRLPNEQ
jgi:type II secretory pathway pseudopilin PulG